MIVKNTLPDVQQTMEPSVKIPIQQVGVQNIKTNFLLNSLEGKTHSVLANVSMSTDLKSETKGISMSRLLRTLIKYLNTPLNQEVIKDILKVFKVAVGEDSKNSFIGFDFDLPIIKQAPITKIEFPQFYKCSFQGRMVGDNFSFYQKVIVPYQSYCICSASLCEHLKLQGLDGFPHAQRCFATVFTHIVPDEIIYLEEIIKIVEDHVVNVYPILKREDEQEVARMAHENPMFVEDAIRFISDGLNSERRIYDWLTQCTHEESIHTSEAIAVNWKGIDDGLNGLFLL
jgi:GTP cyclohydrolase I